MVATVLAQWASHQARQFVEVGVVQQRPLEHVFRTDRRDGFNGSGSLRQQRLRDHRHQSLVEQALLGADTPTAAPVAHGKIDFATGKICVLQIGNHFDADIVSLALDRCQPGKQPSGRRMA